MYYLKSSSPDEVINGSDLAAWDEAIDSSSDPVWDENYLTSTLLYTASDPEKSRDITVPSYKGRSSSREEKDVSWEEHVSRYGMVV